MSTVNIDNKVAVDSGICNCSICLENFKTPKYLPCLHTFCLKCLESYIVSSSRTGKTRPDHFNCPVCRAEVKPPDPTSPVADWAKLMPNNHMINKLMEASSKSSEMPNQTNECDPCKYDGESITGEFWCFDCRDFLCENAEKNTCGTNPHGFINLFQGTKFPNKIFLWL
ncbi:hypothetical protein KUTeg_009896 [Tegillarca granosa]|uniref:RING-type domain-containing protein n=1 Tax=Tegillarca granosa TaxID=220873 RepID=A0ABQ9FA70_TEGGR|nr:hypothetical protein KUTeg_009896 [Tegillarca granosa]